MEGGSGGGLFGGGGGGAANFPPGFFDTEQGQLLLLHWQLRQQYANEHPGDPQQLLPERWTNEQLRRLGSPWRYSIQDGRACWARGREA